MPTRPFCGTDEIRAKTLKEHPNLNQKRERQEQAINEERAKALRNFAKQNNSGNRSSNGTVNYTIPVVVYIVHKFGPENISDQQVFSQIDRLNTEFSPHGINFCIATAEGDDALPGGGIVRIVDVNLTDHNSSTDEVALKALSDLPAERYLRIWVVEDIDNGSGLAGYAQFIGTSQALDGIVMRYDFFGDEASCGCSNLVPGNDQGKILVHEVGHYLRLFHTFENGCAGTTAATCETAGDRVCDTPPIAVNNTGCPAPGSVNSCIAGVPALLDNHMDYTDDNCRESFTPGQAERMVASINTLGTTLVSSENLDYTGIDCIGGVFANFTVDNFGPCVNASVAFTATPVDANPTTPTYTWDFGDGSPAVTGINASHTYTTAGGFNATLTIFDGTNTVSASQLVFVSECAPISGAQANWFFYRRAALDFSSGAPIASDAAHVNMTINNSGGEGCATQSDGNGDLLFYTNSEDVWDKDHTLINAGNELNGNISSAGGVIILPDPGNADLYYILVDAQGGQPNSGFYFTQIDASGPTAILTSMVNVPIPAPTGLAAAADGSLQIAEGITAVKSCDGYWIICQTTAGDHLVVYELTSSGINFSGQFPVSMLSNVTTIKASPDGSRLARGAVGFNNDAGLYVHDFDILNGTISNETQINSSWSYGLSFSPNSTLLYISHGQLQPSTSNGIYQYDLNQTDPNASRRLLLQNLNLYDLQLGPDQKIYGGTNFASRLAVIHQPDELATSGNPNACLATFNGPELNTPNSGGSIEARNGLPNMVDANAATVFSNVITAIPSNCFSYTFTADICGSGYAWNFDDPASGANNTSTEESPTHIFSGEGTYTVTVTVNGETFTEVVEIGFNPVINGPLNCVLPNTTYNYSVSGTPNTNAITYAWSVSSGTVISQATNSNVDVVWNAFPGTLTLVTTDTETGCTYTTVEEVVEPCPNPCAVTAGFTTSITDCEVAFTSTSSTMAPFVITTYAWDFDDGNTASTASPTHTYTQSGIYNVQLTVTAQDPNTGESCTETFASTVTVTCPATCNSCDISPDISYSTIDGCSFDFTGINLGTSCPEQQYVWEISDASGALIASFSTQNASFTFPASGTYEVSLVIAVQTNGTTQCKKRISENITVTCPGCNACDLAPDMVIQETTTCTYSLMGSNLGTPCPSQQYLWEISDASGALIASLPTQNASFVFPASGTYEVSLVLYVPSNGATLCKRRVRETIVVDCTACNECDIDPQMVIQETTPGTYSLTGINLGTVCSTQQYLWEILDASGTMIASIPTQNASFVFPAAGTYEVSLVLYVQHSGSTQCKRRIRETVTVGSGRGAKQLNVSPNPSNGLYLVKVNAEDYRPSDLTILDILGNEVPFQMSTKDGFIQVDIQNSKKGTYFYRFGKMAP